jgi:hypothetical protein
MRLFVITALIFFSVYCYSQNPNTLKSAYMSAVTNNATHQELIMMLHQHYQIIFESDNINWKDDFNYCAAYAMTVKPKSHEKEEYDRHLNKLEYATEMLTSMLHSSAITKANKLKDYNGAIKDGMESYNILPNPCVLVTVAMAEFSSGNKSKAHLLATKAAEDGCAETANKALAYFEKYR